MEVNYEAFGEEWKKEMSKFPKQALIDMLASVNIQKQATAELLLQATRNLGHPAYERSYGTHQAINELREKCFYFLGIPKEDGKK